MKVMCVCLVLLGALLERFALRASHRQHAALQLLGQPLAEALLVEAFDDHLALGLEAAALGLHGLTISRTPWRPATWSQALLGRAEKH